MFDCGNPTHFAARVLQGQCGFENRTSVAMLYFQAASNMLVDVALLIVPTSMIMKSMMNMKAKVFVTIIFLLACS
jgi:hypothetical protein